MLRESFIGKLLRRVHRDERGAVSLETILIVGAIAIPILIFLIKFGWPRIKNYFNKGMEQLEEGADNAAANRTQ
jgi:Flp pilus assembly pilin Flp